MQPEPTTTVIDPPASTPAAATEPAPTPDARLGTLAEAFKQAAPGALKERAGRSSRTTPSPSPEEPAPEASKPGDVQTEAAPSRRGAAAAIKEKDAEIERLAQERIAAQRKADEADQRVKALTEKAQASRRAALEQIGSDDRFEALTRRKLRNEALSWEEDQELERMVVAREHAGVYWELAEQGHKAEVARQLAGLIDDLDLDRDAVLGADLPSALRHAVAATEARVRAETADRVKELEAELKGLRPLAAAARPRAPAVGGASAPPGELPADGASPTSWFAAGIRTRSHQQRGTSGPSARRAS